VLLFTRVSWANFTEWRHRAPMKPTVSAFGSNPIPQVPGAVQSSLIAQQSSGPRAREKTKPQDSERVRRSEVRDEVRLSDPIAAQAIDSKPDAAEEWKHKRPDGRGNGHLDLKA
jgi:hypothetical protein